MKRMVIVLVVLSAGVACSPSHAETYWQWRASLPASYPTSVDYMRVMSKWVKFCEQKGYWDGAKCLGPEGRDLTRTYALILACLVADPSYASDIAGLSKDALRSQLRAAIQNWSPRNPGDSYRSAMILCLAEAELGADNVAKLSEFILSHRSAGDAVQTDGWVEQADHSAENDSWPLGARSMFPAFFPDHEEHDACLQALQEGWVELLCTLDMKDNATRVGTPPRPLNQWTGGVNINADYTFDNHFPVHVGYMYDTIHLIGTVGTVFNKRGHPIPSSFYWNEPNIYSNFLRHLHLWDGRNFYGKGTDWSMYQYGVGSELNYYTGKKFRDNDKVAARIERGLFAHFEWRQRFLDGDLSGFSAYPNMGGLFGDCAYDLVTSYFLNLANRPWTGGFATEAELNARANGNFRSWVSAHTTTNRTKHRLAKAGEGGWAVIPRNGDHMGIWEGSHVGGTDSGSVVGNCAEFDGGFAATQTSCFVALPDGRTVLILEQGEVSKQTWKIGNWVFNDDKRVVFHAGGSTLYDRAGKSGSIPSAWLNVDDKIAYIDMAGGSDTFTASETDLTPSRGSYWAGRYIGCIEFAHKGQGLLIVADIPSPDTATYAASGRYRVLTVTGRQSGGALVTGQDDVSYLVLSNFSDEGQTVSTTLPGPVKTYKAMTGEALAVEGADIEALLGAHTTAVFRVD